MSKVKPKIRLKRCPECRCVLEPIPKNLRAESWVCTKEDERDGLWCDKPAKYTCKNWNNIKYNCYTGRCKKHGEAHVEVRKIR